MSPIRILQRGAFAEGVRHAVRRTLAPVLQRHRVLATFRDDVAQLLAEVEMAEQIRCVCLLNELAWSAQDMAYATGADVKKVFAAMKAFPNQRMLPHEVLRDLVFMAWHDEEGPREPSARVQCYGCGRFRDAGTPCEDRTCHVPGWNLPPV